MDDEASSNGKPPLFPLGYEFSPNPYPEPPLGLPLAQCDIITALPRPLCVTLSICLGFMAYTPACLMLSYAHCTCLQHVPGCMMPPVLDTVWSAAASQASSETKALHQLQCLGSYHPSGRAGMSSRLLAQPQLLRASAGGEPVGQRSQSLSLFAFQIKNLLKKKKLKALHLYIHRIPAKLIC